MTYKLILKKTEIKHIPLLIFRGFFVGFGVFLLTREQGGAPAATADRGALPADISAAIVVFATAYVVRGSVAPPAKEWTSAHIYVPSAPRAASATTRERRTIESYSVIVT